MKPVDQENIPSRNVDPSLDSIAIASSRPALIHWIGSRSLVITLLLVVVLNIAAISSPFEAFQPDRPAGISLLFSCGAIIASAFAMNRLEGFPGVARFHYITPVILSCYAIAIMLILVLRLEYSNFVLGLSLGITLLAKFVLFAIRERTAPSLHYYLVHGGRTDEISLPSNIKLVWADTPGIPEEPGAVIVADLHHDHDPRWLRVFAQAALRGVPVYHVTEVIETITGRVQIDHISENHFGSLLIVGTYATTKRVIDVVVALVLLLLCGPLMIAVAIMVRTDSPGPSLFRQQRVGFRGEIFEVLKFRSMRVQSEVPDARASAMTQEDDHRITRLGRFLRRSRIDELPQLINVVRGEMSLIGPRPEALALSRWYLSELPFYEYRHIVRPGITGWAQVNQGHVTSLTDVREKLNYDFFYIKSFSYWIDMLIVIRTVKTILTGFGSK